MSTSPTVPPWVADLTPAERKRLLKLLDAAEEDWQQFSAAQASCAQRIYQGEERPLNTLRGEEWKQESQEQAKTRVALRRLHESSEALLAELAGFGERVGGNRRALQMVEPLDITLRNMPPAGRPPINKILQTIQEEKEQRTKWFAAIRAAIATQGRPTAPKGKPGRKPKYPKTLALAVQLLPRRGTRKGKTWKEVWEKCKKKSEQVGETLPGMKSFIRRVQDYINKHPE